MAALEGGVALVTGGASGIGRATAIEFAGRGASVVIGDVDADGAAGTVAAIEDAGGEAAFVEADVTDDGDVERLVEAAIERYGGLDAAFNNAGISGERAPIAEYPDETWDRVIDVNLNGVRRCLKHELRRMDEGAIVNTASALGKAALPEVSAYVTAKHGVIGLTRTAALEYAPDVRVNAVCPGFVETEMTRDVREDPERGEAMRAMHAMGRFGRPEEVAGAAVWLCSPAASFVTGEAMGVEGGYLSR